MTRWTQYPDGYIYDCALHCVHCAATRFGDQLDKLVNESAMLDDNDCPLLDEQKQVSPVYFGINYDTCGEEQYCDSCFHVIA